MACSRVTFTFTFISVSLYLSKKYFQNLFVSLIVCVEEQTMFWKTRSVAVFRRHKTVFVVTQTFCFVHDIDTVMRRQNVGGLKFLLYFSQLCSPVKNAERLQGADCARLD